MPAVQGILERESDAVTGDLDAFTAFVKARLDEDEARARSLLSAAQWAVQELAEHKSHYLGRSVPGWHDWPDVVAMCSRALREVEAKRAVLADYTATLAIVERAESQPSAVPGRDYMDAKRELAALQPVAEHLGAVWSDHPDYPDYRAEWKP